MNKIYLLVILILFTFCNNAISQEEAQYADILVDAKYVKWDSTYENFYGAHSGLRWWDYRNNYMDPIAVIGNNPYYISIPLNSYVVLGFTDNVIIDYPDQPDIFLDERNICNDSGDMAAVYVSSDGIVFDSLGVVIGGKTSSLDLASIDYKEEVKFVKVVGLDAHGMSPGFDLISVYGLPNSNIDKYVKRDSIDSYFRNPNHENKPLYLDQLNFDFESYDLKKEGKEFLKRLVRYLGKYPDLKFKIVDHTDDVGSDEYNETLSFNRANEVKKFLIDFGIC